MDVIGVANEAPTLRAVLPVDLHGCARLHLVSAAGRAGGENPPAAG